MYICNLCISGLVKLTEKNYKINKPKRPIYADQLQACPSHHSYIYNEYTYDKNTYGSQGVL